MKKRNLLGIIGAGVVALAGGTYLTRCESSPLRKYVIENYAPFSESRVMNQVGNTPVDMMNKDKEISKDIDLKCDYEWMGSDVQSLWEEKIDNQDYECRSRVLLSGKIDLNGEQLDAGWFGFKEIRKKGEDSWRIDLYHNGLNSPEMFRELGRKLPYLSELMQKDPEWKEKVRIKDTKSGIELEYGNSKKEVYP